MVNRVTATGARRTARLPGLQRGVPPDESQVDVPRGRNRNVSRTLPAASGRRRWTGIRPPWWMVVPALALYLFAVISPSIRGAFYAFTDWNGLSTAVNIVGLDNFARVFAEEAAVEAIRNTLFLTLVVTLFQTGIGLLLAVALNERLKSRNALRLVFFTPVILTPIVSGFIWRYLLAPRGGINVALESLGLGALKHDWLGDPDTALVAVCVAVIWQYAGYSMVIFLAGLKAIPPEVIEAAVVDGAGPVQRLRKVVLPLLNGALVVNLLLVVIAGLNHFDQIYVMTRGGTDTISTAIYESGFLLSDYPYGTAMALVLSLCIGVVALLQFRATARFTVR